MTRTEPQTKKTNKDIWSCKEDVPLSFFLTFAIQGKFWQMLDKDFGRKIDNESIHEIFSLVFNQLNEEQLINILEKIDSKQLKEIKIKLKK